MPKRALPSLAGGWTSCATTGLSAKPPARDHTVHRPLSRWHAERFHLPKPRASLPTHSRSPTPRRTYAAQACQSSGAPPTQTTRVAHAGPATNSPQPGLLETMDPSNDLFHEPEAHPKPSPPGPSPEVTLRDHHLLPSGGPSVIQAGKACALREASVALDQRMGARRLAKSYANEP